MGLFRKLTSIGTGGLVDFRSDKERIARYTKQTRDATHEQTRMIRQGMADAAGTYRVTLASEGEWRPDPTGRFVQRRWANNLWTSYVMDANGVESIEPGVPPR